MSVPCPPVDLACLPRSAHPPWPAAATPEAQVTAALAWLVEHAGPRLVVRHGPITPEALAEAQAQARSGQRVIWRTTGPLPAGPMSTPLKLILRADDLPTPLPPRWWVACSGDPAEVSAILAQHLRDEFPLVLALAPAQPTTWPPDTAWEPGQGRWLRPGPGPVTVCTAWEAPAALAQPGAVFQATSLQPRAIPKSSKLSAGQTK